MKTHFNLPKSPPPPPNEFRKEGLDYKIILIIFIALLCAVSVLLFSGCAGPLRFAPSEPQKQIAFQTHLTARAVNAEGAQPGSQAARQLVGGTETALSYMGMPDSPDIADYETTAQKAKDDAARRPSGEDIFAAAEGGLSLAAELAILFGVGGAGFGGKKVLDWLKLAREKNKALQEIINNNELFIDNVDPPIADNFKQLQKKQSAATKRLVTEVKAG